MLEETIKNAEIYGFEFILLDLFYKSYWGLLNVLSLAFIVSTISILERAFQYEPTFVFFCEYLVLL